MTNNRVEGEMSVFICLISFIPLCLLLLHLHHARRNRITGQQHPSLYSSNSLMVDWSELHKDLLQLISSKLDSELYELRFRSVCSSWRSSIPKNHHHLNLPPSKIPIPLNNNNTSTTYHLSKRTIFLITPPPNQQTLNQNPWLIKIGPDSHGRTRLFNPLSRHKKFPIHSPQIIDFNQHRVLDLGHGFVIGNLPSQPSIFWNMKKLVVVDSDKGHRSVLTIDPSYSSNLAIFRCGDKRWTIIPENSEMKHPYNDVCVFNGRPIAVDVFGRAVTVGLDDLRVDLVAEPVFGRPKKKFLVESDGELLLVSKYLSDSLLDDDGEGLYEGAVTVRFDVFRLDEKNKKWVELTSLGDRILFWGGRLCFSASASDLRIGNGNCVIFRDDNVHSTELEKISVFHLDQRRTSPFPCYSKLFWPPPEWVGLRINDN